jgi:DNA-binding MarR family transcriptional regulator
MRRSRTSKGDAATRVILATFRLNGLLLEAGDRLGAAEGITSARWQVLGAVAVAGRPLTVPQIARRMGVTRQSVHATADRLARDGLLERLPNADHRRSQLLGLSRAGRDAYEAIDARQIEWVNALAGGLTRADLETTARVLDELRGTLETAGDAPAAERADATGAAR